MAAYGASFKQNELPELAVRQSIERLSQWH
jgi:hypothetical protein